MPKLNLPKVLALSLGVLALIFSLNYLVMAVWTEPGVAPPGANVPAPINTGTSSQVKLGGLGVSGSFAADGGAAAGKGLNVINGNVSIGTSTTSAFPLSFSRIVGNKIALWDGGSPDLCYGLGIAPGLLQIFSSYPGRVGIGYASTSSFTETLTVKGPNVGIGIIPSSTSTYRLNVRGSILANGTISGVATPVSGTDAANKDYVDALVCEGGGGGTMPLQGYSTIYASDAHMISTVPISLPGNNCLAKFTVCGTTAPAKLIIGANPVARTTKSPINVLSSMIGFIDSTPAATAVGCYHNFVFDGIDAYTLVSGYCPAGNYCTGVTRGYYEPGACCPTGYSFTNKGCYNCAGSQIDDVNMVCYNNPRCSAAVAGEVAITYSQTENKCIYCPSTSPVYDPVSKNCVTSASFSTLAVAGNCSTLSTVLNTAFTDVTFADINGVPLSTAYYVGMSYSCP